MGAFNWVSDPQAWIGLLTLTALEIVLGIDNIVFISILAGKLPADQQPKARKVGLVLALIPRILLLCLLPLVMRLTEPVLTIPFVGDPDPERKGLPLGLSVQDIIIAVGGLFLLAKATHEIHHKLEGVQHTATDGDLEKVGQKPGAAVASYGAVLVQIMLLNIVFSIDSIVTAIGMVSNVAVMILAVLISTAVMAIAVNAVSAFVEKHPTVKMLALSFLLLIGMTLVIEAFHAHIPKGYVYFAMGFSVFVELLNLKATQRKHTTPVALREPRA